jgi:hypothetical protein
MVDGRTSLRARVGLGILVGGYGLLDLVAATPDSPLRPVLPAGAGPAGWS